MRVTYDPYADAAYIYLREIEPGGTKATVDAEEAEGIAAGGSIMLDFDDDGRLIGIEVLRAKRGLPKELIAEAEELGPPRRFRA